MKNKIGENDLVARLDHSINRYRGAPVFTRVASRKVLNLYKPSNIGGEPIAKISPWDDDFDIESIPLGYFPLEGKIFYVSRTPSRRYVQGVSEKSCTYEEIPGSLIKGRQPYVVRAIFQSTAFEEIVSGKVFDVDQVLAELNRTPGYAEGCLNRDVALAKNELGVVSVFYKNTLVGWMKPNTKVVHVDNQEMGWIISMYINQFNWVVE